LSYEAQNRLFSISKNGAATKFLYDGADVVAEFDGSGTVLRRYIHGSDMDEPVVWFEGSGFGDRRYFIQNYQGSVIAYADVWGNVSSANIYKYGPYGEPKNAANVDSWTGPRFRYTGQTILSDLAGVNLYYYKARVYDPAMGRFLQTDPIGSKDDLDLYAYTGGDPVNQVDPNGKDAWMVTTPFVKGVNHTFIVVADELGGDIKARFTYGPDKAINAVSSEGKLVSLTNTGAVADRADVKSWAELSDPDKAAKAGIVVSRIDAPDEKVIEAGQQVNSALGTPSDPGNIGYVATTNPATIHGYANSNSATFAVAQMASGGNATLPKGRSPGWGQYQRVIDEVKKKLNENK
jgi:RHS repeat-associated protein